MDFGAVGVISMIVQSVVVMGRKQGPDYVTILHQMEEKIAVGMTPKLKLVMLAIVQVKFGF